MEHLTDQRPMTHRPITTLLVIGGSFIVALMLTIVPLPQWADHARPEWVAMVLVYWTLAIPARVGVTTGWITGLLLDVLQGALLGQHALSLALISYFTLQFYQRLRIYRAWQQALVIFMLVLIQQLLTLWILGIIDQAPNSSTLYWLPSLTSMLLWPWTFLILRNLRRRFRMS